MTRTASRFVGDSFGSRALYVGFRTLIVVFTRLWTRTRVVGGPLPATGPFILCPVHRSNMDTPIAGSGPPTTRVRVHSLVNTTIRVRKPT